MESEVPNQPHQPGEEQIAAPVAVTPATDGALVAASRFARFGVALFLLFASLALVLMVVSMLTLPPIDRPDAMAQRVEANWQALTAGSPTPVPTATRTPTPALAAVNAAAFSGPTLAPTLTALPAPSLSPSPISPSATPARRGVQFKLFYSLESFYLLQLDGDDLPVTRLAFERLDPAGQVTARFSGSQWSLYYPYSRAGRCLRILISNQAQYPLPIRCENRVLNGMTIARTSPVIFWLPASGSLEFRMLWQDQEVGRCRIAAGACDLQLP